MPQGWWHCVLNQGFTVAATQNFLSKADLARVWPRVAAQAPVLASLLREVGAAPAEDDAPNN